MKKETNSRNLYKAFVGGFFTTSVLGALNYVKFFMTGSVLYTFKYVTDYEITLSGLGWIQTIYTQSNSYVNDIDFDFETSLLLFMILIIVHYMFQMLRKNR